MKRRRLALILTLIAIVATLACLPKSSVWHFGEHSIVLHRGHVSHVLVRVPEWGPPAPNSGAALVDFDVHVYMRSLMMENLREEWFSFNRASAPDMVFQNTTIALRPVAVAAWLAALLMWVLVWRRKPKRGMCHQCGYNLTGNRSALCPECGAVISCV